MKILKIIGGMILTLIIIIALIITMITVSPMAPRKYTKEIKTGGSIEGKYMQLGAFKVKHKTYKGSETTKKYTIYYPKDLKESNHAYPCIMMLNGTGMMPKKYTSVFKHLASYGFIVVGNDDPSSGFIQGHDETIEWLMNENNNKESLFYNKIDISRMGITGHSQGGAGVLNVLSNSTYKDLYQCAVALSPTHQETAHQLGWMYDLSKIQTPIFLLAGDTGEFELELVIPLDKMVEMYEAIPSQKIIARRKGAEHGQMLYTGNGYLNAYMMAYLQDDNNAKKAFEKSGELYTNTLYSDQR